MNRRKSLEMNALVLAPGRGLAPPSGLPRVIAAAGPKAQHRFLEFFTAHIRNPNTRRAYAHACWEFFCWCDELPVDLHHINPIVVAAYVEQHPGSKPTIKQHLAAIKMLFDWLVVGQIIPTNPAAIGRPPKQVVRQGKTSVLSPDDARHLLDSLPTFDVVGLRDRALIALMLYTFARVSAALAMRVEDILTRNGRMWIRLEDKGGKVLELPAHHQLEAYVAAYLDAAGIRAEKRTPLFRAAAGRSATLKSGGMSRADVYRMIQRRVAAAGIETPVGCHTFRATGITVYLKNGGRLEVAQVMAGHETPRTTALYDRRNGEITVDEVDRVNLGALC